MRLPTERHSTLKFLQQILLKEKKRFTQEEAPQRRLPNFAEFSVIHMLTNKNVGSKIIQEYFPDDPLSVDR